MRPGPDEAGVRGRARELERLMAEIRACRICRDTAQGPPLPHEPRPVLRPSATARLMISSQAPGARVHASGVPFSDASGDRLRAWLGLSPQEFYDQRRIAIVPMGFCFPGHDAAGGDLPPRRECAATWHQRLFAAMPQLELILAVGGYAQRWHLGTAAAAGMTAAVQGWREPLASSLRPRRLALPHPSWRNNAWLTANPWFEQDLLPRLRQEVDRLR
jgi:uracil-DNA glycosylase